MEVSGGMPKDRVLFKLAPLARSSAGKSKHPGPAHWPILPAFIKVVHFKARSMCVIRKFCKSVPDLFNRLVPWSCVFLSWPLCSRSFFELLLNVFRELVSASPVQTAVLFEQQLQPLPKSGKARAFSRLHSE